MRCRALGFPNLALAANAQGESLRGQALIIDIQGKGGEASRETSVESRGQRGIDKIILKNNKTQGHNKLGVSVHFLSFCFITISVS